MTSARMSKKDVEKIEQHVASHKKTLALVRTEHAPTELVPVLRSVAKACSLSLVRTLSSPNSDFAVAEFNSREKMLIVLFIGGKRTELVSVSETDEATVKDLEDSIHSSNFQSEIIRMGL